MKVSVIIPVYNKVDYLDACFQHLQDQQMADIEIIAVDDGSTDGSGQRCDKWASRDARIQVYHTANQGVTAARRYGVEHARAPYVVFVDSDDALMPHGLQSLYDAIVQTEADEVVASFCTHDDRQSPMMGPGWGNPTDMVRAIIAGKNRFPVLWAIIFRRELLSGCLDTPREIIEGEDKLMQVKVLMKQPRVWLLPEQVYRYTLGVPNTRRRTLERERLYDALLREVLRPRWEELHEAYVLHQLKEYEKFIYDGHHEVRQQYYQQAIDTLPPGIPLYDRIVWRLPSRLSRPLIKLYRFAINIKQNRL